MTFNDLYETKDYLSEEDNSMLAKQVSTRIVNNFVEYYLSFQDNFKTIPCIIQTHKSLFHKDFDGINFPNEIRDLRSSILDKKYRRINPIYGSRELIFSDDIELDQTLTNTWEDYSSKGFCIDTSEFLTECNMGYILHKDGNFHYNMCKNKIT